MAELTPDQLGMMLSDQDTIDAAFGVLDSPILEQQEPDLWAAANQVVLALPPDYQRVGQEQPATPTPPDIGDTPAAQAMLGVASDWVPEWATVVTGAGENIVSFGLGLGGMTAAGGNIIWEMSKAMGDKTWYDALDDAVSEAENIMGFMTYTPKTESGQAMQSAIAFPFIQYDRMSSAVANTFVDVAGGGVRGDWDEEQQQIARDFQLVSSQMRGLQDNDEPVPPYLIEAANSLRGRMGDAGMLPFDPSQVSVNNPLLFAGTSLKTFIDFAPDIALGGLKFKKNKVQADEFRSAMGEYGIDLAKVPDQQVLEWGRMMENVNPGMSRFDSLADLQMNVELAQEHAFRVGQQLYEQASKEGGFFQSGMQLSLLDSSLANLAIEKKWNLNIPGITPHLEELSKIISDTAEMPSGKQGVLIDDIWEYRQGLNAEIRLTADSRKPKVKRLNQALLDTRNVVDSFINSQFEAELLGMGDDMLFWSYGAPEMVGEAAAATNRAAIQKWRKADRFWKSYRENFSEQKVVRKMLADPDLTAKSVTNMILGLTATNMKDQAAAIVRTMRNIFPDRDGRPSAQIEAIKTEVKYALFEPLMLNPEAPMFEQFMSNYNKFKSKNNELITELFSPEEIKNLDLVYGVVRSQLRVVEDTARSQVSMKPLSDRLNDRLSRIVAINMVPQGNTGLMKAGFYANVIRGAYNAVTQPVIRGSARSPVPWANRDMYQRRIMSDLYGTDLRRPFTSLKPWKTYFPTVAAAETIVETEYPPQGEGAQRVVEDVGQTADEWARQARDLVMKPLYKAFVPRTP